ncbi:MAG: NTP transferase domain-containing protein [Chitinispirillales bacterium]|jgi:mannose-1-phosphate guanylyltransferase|nr:NTP transferase domain-containing protein [Chitinispirillales bacterium]
MKTIPVILAGGIGERFWPMSRGSAPKQLHAIGTNAKRSMLEETLERVRAFCSPAVKPMLITGASIAQKVMLTLKNPEDVEIISEPVGKNTAPAIALAASIIQKRENDAVMVVVSADHAIWPVSAFTKAVTFAAELAENRGGLIVFGIKPSRPETGYGYIETGDLLPSHEDISAFEVKRFVEKPDADNAQRFIDSGTFLWNSGMFVWKAGAILEEFRLHMPDLYNQAMDAAKKDFTAEAVEEFYRVCPKESIDFGIMEKAAKVSAVAGEFNWDDLGSWESLSRIYGSGENGTTAAGTLIFEQECRNSLIVNKSKLALTAVGLENVAVIAVDDAIMVIDRSKLPDLKKYLSRIKESGVFPHELF